MGEAAVPVDHNYHVGGGWKAEQAQKEAVAKSCQPFCKRWLAQRKACRWGKNQRAIRERWGRLPLFSYSRQTLPGRHSFL